MRSEDKWIQLQLKLDCAEQVAPLANVAVYSLLLSMHLRMLARPALVPWTRNEVLTPPVLQLPPYTPLPQRFEVNAEVYFYVRQLYERDPNLFIQDPGMSTSITMYTL